MIIKKLVLENFGLFAGRCEFDLAPRLKYGRTRPVVLFGGKNGAGKTTTLEAIRLLLYGRRAVGDRMSQREYEDALLGRVHRNKNENTRAPYARVGMAFDHVTAGTRHDYYVERSWTVKRGDRIDEQFRVERNGKALDEVGSTHWESFVSDIVPERLSQLFFFDGEKIKSIAEDISSNAAIAEAIQSLLGLDAVQSLKSDLTIYRTRLLKQANPEAFNQQLGEVEAKLSDALKEAEAVTVQLAEVATQIDGVTCAVADLEKRLAERGGGFADRRVSNKQETEALHRRIQERENAVREICEGILPVVLCPDIVGELRKQMKREERVRENRQARQQVEAVGSFLRQAARESAIRAFLDQKLEKYLAGFDSDEKAPQVHGFSPREAAQFEELLTTRIQMERDAIREHLSGLETDTRSLHRIEKDLAKAPEADVLKEVFDALTEKNRELGRLQEQHSRLKDRKAQSDLLLETLKRERLKMTEKIEVGKAESEKLDRLAKLGPALELYSDRLTRAKITVLESEVSACFNQLARKTDFVKAIRIDPTTFAVSVLDQQGRAVPKEDLSSGEKQIFAIAMLWGLARTSGRPLPVVVDTPLGRLDSDHRANLINNYFPHAGRQVILLSTDTEVDQGLFRELNPAISHCYHFIYDEEQGHTSAREEYFWRERETA